MVGDQDTWNAKTGWPPGRWRYLPVSLVGGLGIALAVAAFLYVSRVEQERQRIVFTQRAAKLVGLVKENIGDTVELLLTARGLYDAFPIVTRDQFRAFARGMLARHHTLQALEWIPRVPVQKRAEYEAAAHRDGFSRFQITELAAPGVMVRAGRRPEYFPVYYVEPTRGNVPALGFDLASRPDRQETLARARDTGQPAATARITLVQETGRQFGLLILVPVFQPGAPTGTVEERRGNLRGFVLAAFRIGDFVTMALRGVDLTGMRLRIVDAAAPAGERLLYRFPPAAEGDPAGEGPEDDGRGAATWQNRERLSVADREWSLVFVADSQAAGLVGSGLAWVALGAGLLVTVSLSGYLGLAINRTHAVATAQATLASEIRTRKRLEGTLEEVHESLRAVFAAAPLAITVLDRTGRVTVWNPAAERMFGWGEQEMLGRLLPSLPEGGQEELQWLRERGLQGQVIAGEELRCQRRDGSALEISVSIVPLRGPGGDPFGSMLLMADITERKRAEGQIQSLARFPGENPNPVLRIAGDGTVLYANPASTALLASWDCQVGQGLPESPLRGQLLASLGASVAHEVEIACGDRSLSLLCAPSPDAKYVNVYGRDITERKQAEEIRTALYRASLDLQETTEVRDRIDRLLKTVRDVLGVDRASILLADTDNQWLQVAARLGSDEPPEGLRVPIGEEGGAIARAYLAQLTIGWDGNGPLPEAYRPQPPHDRLAVSDAQAFACVPLVTQGRAIGVLTMTQSSPHRPLSRATLEFLQPFAGQAAIAIENARLHAAALRHGDQLAALLRATHSVMAGLDLRATLDRIVREAAQISGIRHVKVVLVDREAQVLRIGAAVGRPAEMLEDLPHPLGSGLSGTVAETEEPLFVPDCQNDPRNVAAGQDRQLGIRTYLGLPIKVQNQVLGILTFNTTEPHQYTPDALAYLASFADQAAIAIQNAQLYAALHQRLAELTTTQEIDQAIQANLDLPAVLEGVVAGAMRLLDNPFAQIILWDEATQTLRYGAARGREADRVRNQKFELGRGINGTVALTRRPMILDDYQASPYVVPECFDIVATITVPILFGDRLLGVLHSHTTQPNRRFTSDDLRRFQMLATQAAIAIENARLYDAVKSAAASLEAQVADRTWALEVANRQLQEATRRAQDASRHKSEFVAHMSHELRTPLNAVVGFSELLLDGRSGNLTEKQARYLGHVHKAGKHLLQLIGDILDLSKVEAGKIELQPQLLEVAPQLEEILVIARGLAQQKGLEIRSEIAADSPPLRADPVRFKQIVFNLLGNALKFTPAGGDITLTARPVEARRCLEITVRDTGVGIKADDLPRLFQEFVQLEGSPTLRHEGSGLGLALTKRLVELHGGRIWAASEGEGRGTTMAFTLPFAGPKIPSPEAASSVPPA